MKKVALVVGHSSNAGGASNTKHGVNEFQFNKRLAALVKIELEELGINSVICYRETNYNELPGQVNETKADIAVSLHCNAFNENPNGSEVLYYAMSVKGHDLAASMQAEIVKCLGLKDRGLKPCVASYKGKAGDRGGYLLQNTSMPCVIVEPFFIDSDSSLELALCKFSELAEAYATGISKYIGG